MIYLLILNDRSRNIFCSQLKLEGAKMLHQYALLHFLLEESTYGIDLL